MAGSTTNWLLGEIAFRRGDMEMAGPLIQLGDTGTAEALLTSLVSNNHEHPEYLERAQTIYAHVGLAQEGRDLVAHAARSVMDTMGQGVKLAREGRLARLSG
jgi:hypothetical protein